MIHRMDPRVEAVWNAGVYHFSVFCKQHCLSMLVATLFLTTVIMHVKSAVFLYGKGLKGDRIVLLLITVCASICF